MVKLLHTLPYRPLQADMQQHAAILRRGAVPQTSKGTKHPSREPSSRWIDEALLGMENALRANTLDIR